MTIPTRFCHGLLSACFLSVLVVGFGGVAFAAEPEPVAQLVPAYNAPTGQPINPIAASAAAKIEKHLKVPVRDKPAESLIKKAPVPLEAVAKGADKKIRIHTIRHATCFESGHDKFDEKVTEFLNEVGEANLIGVHTINYTFLDIASQKMLNDFGVVIVYRG